MPLQKTILLLLRLNDLISDHRFVGRRSKTSMHGKRHRPSAEERDGNNII